MYGFIDFRCGLLNVTRHFPHAFLIEMYNYCLRKGHVSGAEPIFGFDGVTCPHREEVEVGVGMFKSRDDIHILPMFWFRTVRESKEADEVC